MNTPFPPSLHGGEPQPAHATDPAGHDPAPVDPAKESVAGEEDPGASLDLGDAAAPSDPSQPQSLPRGR